jgi:endonuclease YncB( thermonuclease family)
MDRRRIFIMAALALVAVLSALDHAGAFGYRGGDRTRYDGVVTKIAYAADGDTIDVDIPDGTRSVTRILLRGIDCPEIARRGRDGRLFCREAADFVRKEIVGRSVRLAMDPARAPRDKYGRLLAYI